MSLAWLPSPWWPSPQPSRRLVARAEGCHGCGTMLWRSSPALPTHPPGSHGASRAPHVCVSLVAYSASDFAGPADWHGEPSRPWDAPAQEGRALAAARLGAADRWAGRGPREAAPGRAPRGGPAAGGVRGGPGARGPGRAPSAAGPRGVPPRARGAARASVAPACPRSCWPWSSVGAPAGPSLTPRGSDWLGP